MLILFFVLELRSVATQYSFLYVPVIDVSTGVVALTAYGKKLQHV